MNCEMCRILQEGESTGGILSFLGDEHRDHIDGSRPTTGGCWSLHEEDLLEPSRAAGAQATGSPQRGAAATLLSPHRGVHRSCTPR